MRFADLDAVTFDAFGTLVELVDPVPALEPALRVRGVTRSRDVIRAAFEAEAAYYRPRSSEGRDPESLRRLREKCARVFLEAAGSDLDPAAFAPVYVDALSFRVLPGIPEQLASLRARGLRLAVVGNWDVSLVDRLEELGLAHFFSVVVPCARKPRPDGLLEALAALGVEPGRALHVGDTDADAAAARAAGVHFARVPLAEALAELA
jgi:putative hydrolase of the HAD superfamily